MILMKMHRNVRSKATDEQGYEESCDDEKNEPSFTSGVDDLEMDNGDENKDGWFTYFLKAVALMTDLCGKPSF